MTNNYDRGRCFPDDSLLRSPWRVIYAIETILSRFRALSPNPPCMQKCRYCLSNEYAYETVNSLISHLCAKPFPIGLSNILVYCFLYAKKILAEDSTIQLVVDCWYFFAVVVNGCRRNFCIVVNSSRKKNRFPIYSFSLLVVTMIRDH